ncbi:protein kinase, putative [Bodo saltans]|uniref:Protein kinase, putative n=1 Tax=Bodo saltans TaxID=75058 RepID=A0A0S4IZ59_BODSA|nr:protein kinase, putative [Bodo saltans]|eukprot:CUG26608.1 protein kinase, putative [Bodo saltans]
MSGPMTHAGPPASSGKTIIKLKHLKPEPQPEIDEPKTKLKFKTAGMKQQAATVADGVAHAESQPEGGTRSQSAAARTEGGASKIRLKMPQELPKRHNENEEDIPPVVSERDHSNPPPLERNSTATPPKAYYEDPTSSMMTAMDGRGTQGREEATDSSTLLVKRETPGTRLKQLDTLFPAQPPATAIDDEIQMLQRPPRNTSHAAMDEEAAVVASTGGDGGSIAGASQEEESVTTQDTQRTIHSLLGSRVSGGSPTPTSMAVPFQYPAVDSRKHPKAGVPLPAASAGPSRMTPTTSTVSSKYEILQKVGEGTYGEVNRGRDKETNAIVALKRIKTLEGLDGFPLTSVREVIALKFLSKTLRGVERSHFVMLRDVVLSDDFQSVYLVFDFVEHSLAGLAMRLRELRFGEVDIGTVFLRILRGVQILHERSIMHRDLKLDNILVGKDAQVQLCDFGLSVPMGSGRQFLTPSLINLLYRPPEMLLGSLSYSPAVDVWSVGCMLAQMLLGEPPFLVRDKDRAGSELGQLEAITAVLGPYTEELSRDMGNIVDRKYNRKTLEMLRCIPKDGHHHRDTNNSHGGGSGGGAAPSKKFSTWMRRHHRLERTQPLSDDLYEVLDATLQVDPSKRATVDALLKLPFFKRMANGEAQSIRSIVERLRRLPSSHLLSVRQEIHDARARHQQQQQR